MHHIPGSGSSLVGSGKIQPKATSHQASCFQYTNADEFLLIHRRFLLLQLYDYTTLTAHLVFPLQHCSFANLDRPLPIFDFGQTFRLCPKVDTSLAFNNTLYTPLASNSEHLGSAPSMLVGMPPIRVGEVSNILQMDYGSAGSILWQL